MFPSSQGHRVKEASAFWSRWCEGPRSLHSTPTVVAVLAIATAAFGITVTIITCWHYLHCCYHQVCHQKPKVGRVLLLSSSSLLVFHQCLPLAEPTRSQLTECLGNAAFVISYPLLHISTHNMLGMRPLSKIIGHIKPVNKIIQNWNSNLDFFLLKSGTRQRCKLSLLFFFKITLLGFESHSIQSIHLKCTIQ